MELRPVERRVVKMLKAGQQTEAIAVKFYRTPNWVELVSRMADYKQNKT